MDQEVVELQDNIAYNTNLKWVQNYVYTFAYVP